MLKSLSSVLTRRFSTIRSKLSLALGAIAVVLLISSLISVMEYIRMSDYVSGMIADDVKNIAFAQKLADMSGDYNLEILAVIGDDSRSSLPDFDFTDFTRNCDSLRSSLSKDGRLPLADSVEYAYSAYMLVSTELPAVLRSDFVDSRTWYFERLQPRYYTLRDYIGRLNSMIYESLEKNSATFDRGFYRSIIPGIVAVGVGLLLILMLFFYLLSYYVKPIEKIRKNIGAYRSLGKKYSVAFEGDDELSEINDAIGEIANENIQLRKRLFKRNESEGDQ